MQIEIPIFRQISRDLKLAPRAFQVWRAVIERLDLLEWRETKLEDVARNLVIDASTVSRALTTLVEHGYLLRKEGASGVAALYRVPLSRVQFDVQRETCEPVQLEASPTVAAPRVTRRVNSRVVSRGIV